jgi:hypothetical protein
MIHHFVCQPTGFKPYAIPLVFDWDDETGEITGPGADMILEAFKEGYVKAHPYPCDHDLTDPRNKTDLAAVVGWAHVLPPELADHYPRGVRTDPNVYDMDGNVVDQVYF